MSARAKNTAQRGDANGPRSVFWSAATHPWPKFGPPMRRPRTRNGALLCPPLVRPWPANQTIPIPISSSSAPLAATRRRTLELAPQAIPGTPSPEQVLPRRHRSRCFHAVTGESCSQDRPQRPRQPRRPQGFRPFAPATQVRPSAMDSADEWFYKNHIIYRSSSDDSGWA